MGTSKLHTLIIVIGGNYTYTMYIKKIYIYIIIYIIYINTMFLVGLRALKKKNNDNN